MRHVAAWDRGIAVSRSAMVLVSLSAPRIFAPRCGRGRRRFVGPKAAVIKGAAVLGREVDVGWNAGAELGASRGRRNARPRGVEDLGGGGAWDKQKRDADDSGEAVGESGDGQGVDAGGQGIADMEVLQDELGVAPLESGLQRGYNERV